MWLFVLGGLSWAVADDEDPGYFLYGDQRVPATMADDEVAIVGTGQRLDVDQVRAALRAGNVSAQPVASSARYVVVKLAGATAAADAVALNAISQRSSSQGVMPVLMSGKTRLITTGEILVHLSAAAGPTAPAELAARYGIDLLRQTHVQNVYVYRVQDVFDVVRIANAMAESGDVEAAYPNLIDTGKSQAGRPLNPNDEFFPDMWHLRNTGVNSGGSPGEDINLRSIWSLYTGGPGQVVAVVDDFVEFNHPDLRRKVFTNISVDYSYVPEIPEPPAGDDDDDNQAVLAAPPFGDMGINNHGTAVAGVIAARGGNRIGVVGVAPNALLTMHRVFSDGAWIVTTEEEADALSRHPQVVDVYNNSWEATALLAPMPTIVGTAIRRNLREGRGRLGSIYVIAAGNGALNNDNTNFSGYTNNSSMIVVGASDFNGRHAEYSTPGATVLVNAPSAGNGGPGIFTTDFSGPDGVVAGDYWADFDGTSAATPIVSGVIALMLQANPDLTWQDVRHILLTTAEKNSPNDSSWMESVEGGNTSGVLPYSHLFGFGRVDADRAVRTAAEFRSLGPRQPTIVSKTKTPVVPESWSGSENLEFTIDFSEDEEPGLTNLFIEHVNVNLDVRDSAWGASTITLVSPSGTSSVLNPGQMSGTTGDLQWTFGSVRHYGETIRGSMFSEAGEGAVWTIRFENGSGTLNSVTITFEGRVDNDNGGFGDGLPDQWEIAHFGSNVLLDNVAATDDPNEDGKTNLEHFMDGTSPVNRTLIVYRLSEQVFLEGKSDRIRQARRGILVNDRDNVNGGLYALLSYRDPVTGGLFYHEEHWGQMADWGEDSGAPAILKFLASGDRRQNEVITATDFYDTPVGDVGDGIADLFTSRILVGSNVSSADQFGITRAVLARALRGTIAKYDHEGGIFGDGRLSARIDRRRTIEANRTDESARRVLDEYKTFLDRRYTERFLTLEIDVDTVDEDSGTTNAIATLTHTTSNGTPRLLRAMRVFLTSHDPHQVEVPNTVTIPANQSSVTFPVTITPIRTTGNPADDPANRTRQVITDDVPPVTVTEYFREVQLRATAEDRSPAVLTITIEDVDD